MMNTKTILTTVTPLLLLSNTAANAQALFEAPTRTTEMTLAQHTAVLSAQSKTNVKSAWVQRVKGSVLNGLTTSIELNLNEYYTVRATILENVTRGGGTQLINAEVVGVTITDDSGKAVDRDSGKAVDRDSGKAVDRDSGKAVDRDAIMLVVNNQGMLTGTVRVEGRLFTIRPLSNGTHLITEQIERAMKPAHIHDDTVIVSPQPGTDGRGSDDSDDTSTIRALVVYTPGVTQEVADVSSLIELAVAETNQGFINSEVNAEVELAAAIPVRYSAGDMGQDLARLQATNDGYMDEVHTYRNQYSADVVIMLTPSQGYACGQAAAIGATAETAFAIVAQDCAAGYYSFGHEIGHLMSARHNIEHDPSVAVYPDAHGYQDPNNQWRTVMSYPCASGCPRINSWSNPDVTTLDGTATGTVGVANNARVLNQTAAYVASFRD